MEIQSALQGENAIPSEFNCNPNEAGKFTTLKRLFSCSKCGKVFTTKSKLDCHERIHTGDKPFRWSKCEKKFSQADILKRHERMASNHSAVQSVKRSIVKQLI